MIEIFIRTIGEADGFPMHEAWDESVQGPIPAGAVVIPRLPEAFEKWVDGAWVLPAKAAKARADWSVPAERIAEARAQKRIEALLIKSGVALAGGLLAAEAGLRKITPDQMADMVIAKADAFVADELARQDASIAPVAVDAKP